MKAESLIEFIANEVNKRIISRNNVIVHNIPDRILIKTDYAKSTLNVNKGVEITTNHNASAAGSTDAATLSHVLQYSDIPTKNSNLPVMSVVTFDSQCTSNDVTNPILPSLPLEVHKQVLSSNATTLKNAVEIKIPLPRKKNVSKEPSGSRSSIKNTTMTVTNKNKTVLLDIMLYLTHRREGYNGRFGSNVSQDVHCNHYVSRPNIGQTTMIQRTLQLFSNLLNNIPVRRNYSQHFPIGQDGLLGYTTSNALNNKLVRHNYSQHFPIGQDGLLGYAPSTQLEGACLNCPPNQVQQINPLYQNNDDFALRKSLVPLAIQFSKPYELYIPDKYRNKLKRLQNRYFKSNDFTAVAQITIIFNQIKEKHRLKSINEELLALNTDSKVQKLTLFFNKRNKATRNVDISCIQHNSSFIYDFKTMADPFFSIFANGVENISGYTSRVMCVTSNSIKSISFTCMKINKAVNTLKLSKYHGVDGISSFLYKYGGPDTPLLLRKLFTLSMETGSYPYCWKTAYIIPRYKSGDKNDMNNYRPIKITPVISRIMEKIISDELSNYLLAGKLIDDTQHGFLKNRACMTCHFDPFNLVYSLRSQRFLVLALYLDISKAFDMVSHQLPTGKLASYGVQNPLLAWLDPFLINRHQIVKMNSSLSNAVPVRNGVIQGSVLGPLLFLLFINDIRESFCVGNPLLYADDLKVVYSFSPHNLNNMQNCISMELNKVAQWCLKWQLELNTAKCGWICFGDTSINLNITINGEVLSRLHTVVDLGLRYS
ncbi:unnamed protein product [Schistosoma curassoni]|uniref:Reverse transcriptase domain-containing protein n=1 Tax=Schistosoma curassoni TaxID=6186 RepID=A0A183KMW8_9TREM|nr:unnamed protein product [Schistosoma curassoni]